MHIYFVNMHMHWNMFL